MIKIKEKLNSIKIAKPARAGFFYIATNVLSKAVTLFATPLFTRLLSPAEYGLYSLYVSWMGIVSVITALGISGGTIYRGLGKYIENEEALISSAIGILVASFTSLSILAALFWKRLSDITGLMPHVNFLLIFEVFLGCAQTVIFAFERYRYSYIKICLVNLLYATLSVGVSLILIYLTPLRAAARIYASFLSSAFLILPVIRRYLKPKHLYNKEIWSYLLRLSLPLLPNAIAMTLIAQVDKLMIERYFGAYDLGKYSIAYSVGFMLTTLTTALYTSLQPWLMRKLNSGHVESARLITKRIILVTSLGLLIFLLLMPEIFRIIAGPEYRDAEFAVYPLALAGFLQFIANLFAANIIHTEKTAFLSLSAVIAFVFNLILNILLIPIYSYKAAAVTTALSYGILIFAEYIFLKKNSSEKIIDGRSLAPLLLSLAVIPIYLLRFTSHSRWLFALAVLLAALPVSFKLIKAFIEKKKTESAI